jgi:prefoldin subunit 5
MINQIVLISTNIPTIEEAHEECKEFETTIKEGESQNKNYKVLLIMQYLVPRKIGKKNSVKVTTSEFISV